MKEKDYLELCMICNRLLALPESTLEMVAIPWLHVIREHPIVLEKYESLFSPKSIIENIKVRFFNILVWFRQVFRALRSDGAAWFGIDTLPENLDVLFISHLLNPSQYGEFDDFYFSSIPERLRKKGRSVAIASISHFGGHEVLFNKHFAKTKIPRVYFTGSLDLKSEIALRKQVRSESRRLRTLEKNTKNVLEQRILDEASIKVLSGSAQTTLRLTHQVKALIQATNPKVIIVPYEGHAYERVIFATAHQVNKNIRCVSYQHTGIFRLSNGIRQVLKPEFNPDMILTSGWDGKQDLENALGLKELQISVLGSVRGLMHNAYQDSLNIKSGKERCLVIPEGFYSECISLLGFSLDCAYLKPEIEFIWRLHPSVTFEYLKTKHKAFRSLPKNIILSSGSLEEDIAQSAWALYRGTSAIYKAISGGLRPIYLKRDEEMTIDPLYKMNNWKVEVNTIAEFIECVERDIGNGMIFEKSDLILAKKICENQFSQIDITPLNDLIA